MQGVWNYVYELIIKYGYLGLYVGLAIEGTGMPGPVELLFLAAAYFVQAHKMSLVYSIVVATIGNLSGNIMAYSAGYYGGRPIMDRLNRYLHVKQEDLDKVEVWFNKYGGLVNMVSRWIGITRTPAIWAAGIMRMNVISYAFFSLIGDAAWATFWMLVCVYAYANIKWLLGLPVWYKLAALAAAIAVIYFAWKLFFKYMRKGHN